MAAGLPEMAAHVGPLMLSLQDTNPLGATARRAFYDVAVIAFRKSGATSVIAEIVRPPLASSSSLLLSASDVFCGNARWLSGVSSPE